MALILECTCSANVSLCNLIQLIWNVDVVVNQAGSITATGRIWLSGDNGAEENIFIESPGDAGIYSFDLTPLADWLNPTAHITINASTFQISGGSYEINAGDGILQRYQCVNVISGATVITEVPSSATVNDGEHKCETGPHDTRSVCQDISGTLFKSTPLGACNGCGSSHGQYYPPPTINVTVDVDNSGELCLCATGGSGDYSYSIISGQLPCGQTLNVSTGCIEGSPDGSCDGTSSITFRVTDAGGAGPGSTGGETIGGTCRVFGSGATRISGGAWTSAMTGTITINGHDYTIATVTPPDNLTTVETIGIIDPTSWSYTFPIIPPPPPGPPETADVTCGYIFACPAGDQTIGGNQAF